MKAENAAVRELLRKMDEQQRALLEQVERLQRRLDGITTAIAPPGGPADITDATQNTSTPQVTVEKQEKEDRYQDGIIIWQNPETAKVPFLLKFNNNTQVRYLNTLDSTDTFTDHLGNVREVHRRNDITVNRSMFIFAGYMFDPKLQYSLTVWTSAGASSIVVAGNIGYLAFVGNGLNTLNISANKIDTNLLLAGSVWWEPLAPYSEAGKSRQMYDDYFASSKTRIRVGSSFTRSREDRFSDTDQSSPRQHVHLQLRRRARLLYRRVCSGRDGRASYLQDVGDRRRSQEERLSVNGQYYVRWLSDFDADGPLPLASTFDHGFELSAGQFVIPKTLVLYARGSKVFGEFANPYEYAGGLKWYLLPTERLWLTGELMRVHKAPYSGAFTPYTAGMTGWMPMLQTVLAF